MSASSAARTDLTGVAGSAPRIALGLHAGRLEQLLAVIDSAMDAILTVDASHLVVVFNQAAATMFGVPAAEAIGSPLDRFLPAAARQAQAGQVGRVRSLSGLRADGTKFPIEATLAVSGEGEGRMLTAVVRDATEHRIAEAALREKERAEEANRAKTDFLSRVSHELRTPLNAILGFAQLMESDTAEPLPATQARRAELIRLSGARLLHLINDLLDLTKIEQGMFAVESVPLDVGPAVAQALDLVRPEAALRQLTLRAEPTAEALHVLADPRAVDQVLLNLLSNAVKYNRDGGSVWVTVRREGRAVAISVADTGAGIPKGLLDQLFQPFSRLGAQATSVPGTGLGLAIARQLARLMGGDIRVDSKAGEGTCMTLRLPWTRRGEQRPAPANADLLQTDWIADLGGHALYIEDDPVNALLMEQIFARTPGWTIDLAVTAQDGLLQAASGRYDLVLTDMNLPDRPGIQVIGHLRAQPGTARQRIVAVSADALPQQIDAALQAGADDYWTKPLDPAVIQRLLRQGRAVG